MAADGSDNFSKPVEAPAHAPDNFNRTDLYNGMSSGAGRSPGMGPGGDGGAAGGGGDKATHLDFAAAGDIYGGKASQNGMGGMNKPDVQQAGLSGRSDQPGVLGRGDQSGASGRGDQPGIPNGTQGDGSPNDASKPEGNKNVDRFGMSHDRPDMPKDGVVTPNVNEKGQSVTPEEMMSRKQQQGNGVQTDSGRPDAPVAGQTDSSGKPTDQVTASKQDGKVNEVSSYNANDNKLTQYNMDGDGQVASRTTTDMNDGSKDSVKYDDTGHANSHQVQKPGQAPQDAPVNNNETAYTTKDSDGNLKTIEASGQDGNTKIGFGDNGHPNSVDRDQRSADGTSTSTHENLDGDGKADYTATKSYDSNHNLKSETAQDRYSSDTKSYDNGQLTQDKYQDRTQTRQTDYMPDRTETNISDISGREESMVKKNDGSSMRMVHDPNDGGSTTYTGRAADGSTDRVVDSKHYTQEQVSDGKTGAWASTTTDKGGGVTKKSYGQGQNTYENFSETPI